MMFEDSAEHRGPLSKSEKDAIHIGIAFLEVFFSSGQGLVVFGLFGLETQLVTDPFVKCVEIFLDIHNNPPTTDNELRFYHWTIKHAAKISAFIPTRKKRKTRVWRNATCLSSPYYSINYNIAKFNGQ